MYKKILLSLALLFTTTAVLAGGLEIRKEIKVIKQSGDKFIVGAHADQYCNGGVSLTMHDEHVIRYLSISCLKNNQVDALIVALEEAKIEANKFRSINQ